jgi:dTDP-L-rhamnose 4-epimerase
MIEKILITGGAGFIGSKLALELVNRGHSVTVLDNLSKQVHGNGKISSLYLSIKDKVNFIKGDVRNKTDWKKGLND